MKEGPSGHLFLAMRLKDGKQTCPKCQGNGCYWCRRTGWMAQCPACMNNEHELLIKDENEFSCLACGARFDEAGQIVHVDKTKKKLVPKRA